MPTHKLKKFCRLTQYIEQTDKTLFQAIEDLCALGYFKPSYGSDGITFLYPSSKSYVTKIVNGAYSKNDKEYNTAKDMISSLILNKYYPDTKSLGSEVVNKLGHRMQVTHSAKGAMIGKDITLTLDKDFVSPPDQSPDRPSRNKMSVFTLSGKGEIPLTKGSFGITRNEPKKEVKKGGHRPAMSARKNLQEQLAANYRINLKDPENIFVKKVCLQLKMITKNGCRADLLEYLGNDEISDSFLLDMYCSKHCPDCFSKLSVAIECFTDPGQGAHTNVGAYTDKVSYAGYTDLKKKIIVDCGGGSEAQRPKVPDLFKYIKNLREICDKIDNLYLGKEERLGRDTFIVFCNIQKDGWLSAASPEDSAEIFEAFFLLAHEIYLTREDLLMRDKEFSDFAWDMQIYGNLFKSDILLYEPYVVTEPYTAGIPPPEELKEFSLSGHILHLRNSPPKSGGSATCHSVLQSIMD
jgi:hypothetical protein